MSKHADKTEQSTKGKKKEQQGPKPKSPSMQRYVLTNRLDANKKRKIAKSEREKKKKHEKLLAYGRKNGVHRNTDVKYIRAAVREIHNSAAAQVDLSLAT